MTGRRAARDHDGLPIGPAVDDDPSPGSGEGRGPSVAPQPRPTPGGRASAPRRDGAADHAATPAAPVPTPARPTPAAPTPTPTRPGPKGPAGADLAGRDEPPGPTGSSVPGGVQAHASAAVEVEPTTGAPVDAVPRRVPVRQQSGWHRGATPPGGVPATEDGLVFWAPIEEVHWDGTPIREDSAPRRRRGPARRTPAPPDPLPGLAVLVLLSLVAAFFAWVSAGPFWLAVGHARVGTVLVDDCTGGGLTQRCRGIFTADDGQFVAYGVRVSGVPAGRDTPGTALAARMTGSDGGTAYADTGAGRHLRWLPGLLVVVGCAAGIARWTGSTRLPGRRNRRWAVFVALAGPALITLGFLAAAW
ncbi:hypothetical protein V6V47_14760 [Micromonospora sp. CPCC 205539]